MAFYDMSKEERRQLVEQIRKEIMEDLKMEQVDQMQTYFSDEDTYIRKTAYQAVGKIYVSQLALRAGIFQNLRYLLTSDTDKVRQTTINAAGEVGMVDFEVVRKFFEKGLSDHHHAVRNAVIGSIKKVGQKNPEPVLRWARQYLHHEDKEIRREICHGIELRGRTHPQDILPMLKLLQNDQTSRVRNTLIHVLGQIAYKKGCLETVVTHLNSWENKQLVQDALEEIVDVHDRYKNFAALTRQEAIDYIEKYAR